MAVGEYVNIHPSVQDSLRLHILEYFDDLRDGKFTYSWQPCDNSILRHIKLLILKLLFNILTPYLFLPQPNFSRIYFSLAEFKPNLFIVSRILAEFVDLRQNPAEPDISRNFMSASRISFKIRLGGLLDSL